jgi:hypothetical protein
MLEKKPYMSFNFYSKTRSLIGESHKKECSSTHYVYISAFYRCFIGIVFVVISISV